MYIRFTNEEIEYANHVDIVQYALRNGLKVVEYHKGYFKVPGYGGLLLEPDKWYWESKKKGGGPIQFVMNMKNVSWVEAVKELLNDRNDTYMYASECKKQYVSKADFQLPRQNSTYKHLFAYLVNARQLDSGLIQDLVKQKRLYEDYRENCVFVGNDQKGIARYAFCRSTKTHISYKGEVSGSDKKYSFSLPGENRCLYVFEAAIDLLSYITLQKLKGEEHADHYLSLGGCSLRALDYYLTNYDIERIICCTDFDEAGERVYVELREQYGMLYFIGRESSAPFKDWNDYLTRYRMQKYLEEQEE